MEAALLSITYSLIAGIILELSKFAVRHFCRSRRGR